MRTRSILHPSMLEILGVYFGPPPTQTPQEASFQVTAIDANTGTVTANKPWSEHPGFTKESHT